MCPPGSFLLYFMRKLVGAFFLPTNMVFTMYMCGDFQNFEKLKLFHLSMFPGTCRPFKTGLFAICRNFGYSYGYRGMFFRYVFVAYIAFSDLECSDNSSCVVLEKLSIERQIPICWPTAFFLKRLESR